MINIEMVIDKEHKAYKISV